MIGIIESLSPESGRKKKCLGEGIKKEWLECESEDID